MSVDSREGERSKNSCKTQRISDRLVGNLRVVSEGLVVVRRLWKRTLEGGGSWGRLKMRHSRLEAKVRVRSAMTPAGEGLGPKTIGSFDLRVCVRCGKREYVVRK